MHINELLSVPCLLSDLHKLALAYSAGRLSEKANIVEIGTYRGGSAHILSESTRATVYTIDAFDNVDPELIGPDSTIRRHIGDARSFAATHPDCTIDFLFIDGDHTFFGVHHDYFALRELLAADAVIAFHDWGMSYPGVRIFCDALFQAGAITDCVEVGGMLMCRLASASSLPDRRSYKYAVDAIAKLFEENSSAASGWACSEKYEAIVNNINRDWTIIGRGSFGAYFSQFFRMHPDAAIDSGAAKADGKYIVCSHYQDEIVEFLRNKIGVKQDNIVSGNEILSYGMYRDVSRNSGERLASMAPSEDEALIVQLFSELPEEIVSYLAKNSFLLKTFLRTTALT